MIEKTELRSDLRGLDENELDLIAGGFDGYAAARAAQATLAVVSFGGSPYMWFYAAAKLA